MQTRNCCRCSASGWVSRAAKSRQREQVRIGSSEGRLRETAFDWSEAFTVASLARERLEVADDPVAAAGAAADEDVAVV